MVNATMIKPSENYNEYHRLYNKQRYDERITEAIKILGGKCKFCDSTQNLHIDHIAPVEKRYDIHYATRLSYNKFIEEVNKCQLLCDKCHGFKTAIQNGNIVGHGMGKTGKKNCKCSLCAEKKREYIREFMRNKRAKLKG
jgi:hypothetical protein